MISCYYCFPDQKKKKKHALNNKGCLIHQHEIPEAPLPKCPSSSFQGNPVVKVEVTITGADQKYCSHKDLTTDRDKRRSICTCL